MAAAMADEVAAKVSPAMTRAVSAAAVLPLGCGNDADED